MNYPYLIPNMQGNPASFVANSTGVLGSYDQSTDAISQVSVDYSQLVPAVTLESYFFKVSPGGMPQLAISAIVLTPASNSLGFIISGGIAGRAYTVAVNAQTNIGIRTDILTVNVLGDDDCGCAVVPSLLTPPGSVSGDGGVYVNTAPRFFVSSTAPIGARMLDRWYDTSTGDVYDFISNGAGGYWALAIPTGGSGPTPPPTPISAASILKISPIVPDGVKTVFTLTTTNGVPVAITGTNGLFVSVDGVWQEPSTQFVADGNSIIFTQAPSADANVFMLWFSSPSTSDGGASGANIKALNYIIPDGVTTSFFLGMPSGVVAVVGSNTLFVSVDGVWQEPGVQYIAAAALITFTQAPSADAYIFMLWFAPPGV